MSESGIVRSSATLPWSQGQTSLASLPGHGTTLGEGAPRTAWQKVGC